MQQGDGDVVTQAEAARRLGLNRSTVKRYCDRHPALMTEDGRVLLDAMREHRGMTVNPALQTRGHAAAPKAAEGALDGLNADRARHQAAKAAEAELDLADRLGMTLRRDDVERALAAAAETIRQVAMRLARENCEALARLDDPRAVEVQLEQMMLALQERAARALTEAAGGNGESDAA